MLPRCIPSETGVAILKLDGQHEDQHSRGPHSTMDSVLPSHPAAPGSNPGVSEIFLRKIVDVTKVNRRHCCLEKWTAEA